MPSFQSRIQAALKAFRRPSITAGQGLTFSVGFDSTMLDGDNRDLPFGDWGTALAVTQSIPAYRSAFFRQRAVGQMPWEIYNQQTEEVVAKSTDASPRHPLAQAIQLNRYETGHSLFSLWEFSLSVWGKSFVGMSRNLSGFATTIHWLHPLAMDIYAPQGELLGWHFQGTQDMLEIPRDNVVFDRYVHPTDAHDGLAPMEVAIGEVNIDRNFKRYLRARFRNHEAVSKIFSPKDGQVLQPEDIDDIRKLLREQLAGPDNAYRSMVLPKPMDVALVQQSDLARNEPAVQNNKEDIYEAFGVARSVVGNSSDSRYQQSEQDRIATYEGTIIPECTSIADSINLFLMPEYDFPPVHSFRFVTKKFESIPESKQTEAQIIRDDLAAGLITQEEARRLRGYQPLPLGQTIQRPQNPAIQINVPQIASGHPVLDKPKTLEVPAPVYRAMETVLVLPEPIKADDVSEADIEPNDSVREAQHHGDTSFVREFIAKSMHWHFSDDLEDAEPLEAKAHPHLGLPDGVIPVPMYDYLEGKMDYVYVVPVGKLYPYSDSVINDSDTAVCITVKFDAERNLNYQHIDMLTPKPHNRKAMQGDIHSELKTWRSIALKSNGYLRDFEPEHLRGDYADFLKQNLPLTNGDATKVADLFNIVKQDIEWVTEKAIQATRLDFENGLWDILAAASDETNPLPRRRAGILIRNLIAVGSRKAFEDGLRAAGVDEAPDTDDQALIAAHVRQQSQYVSNLLDVIYTSGISEGDIQSKPAMWWNKSVSPMYQAGRMSADKNGMYEWVIGATEKHCKSCSRANGQRHRMKGWLKYTRPQADNLECSGFNCDCRFVKIFGRARGRLKAIPLTGLLEEAA